MSLCNGFNDRFIGNYSQPTFSGPGKHSLAHLTLQVFLATDQGLDTVKKNQMDLVAMRRKAQILILFIRDTLSGQALSKGFF
jgi:hypothetical protein